MSNPFDTKLIKLQKHEVFGTAVVPDMPEGCDMVIICVDRMQHEPYTLRLPHQVYVETIAKIFDADDQIKSVTIIPCSSKSKLTITLSEFSKITEESKL